MFVLIPSLASSAEAGVATGVGKNWFERVFKATEKPNLSKTREYMNDTYAAASPARTVHLANSLFGIVGGMITGIFSVTNIACAGGGFALFAMGLVNPLAALLGATALATLASEHKLMTASIGLGLGSFLLGATNPWLVLATAAVGVLMTADCAKNTFESIGQNGLVSWQTGLNAGMTALSAFCVFPALGLGKTMTSAKMGSLELTAGETVTEAGLGEAVVSAEKTIAANITKVEKVIEKGGKILTAEKGTHEALLKAVQAEVKSATTLTEEAIQTARQQLASRAESASKEIAKEAQRNLRKLEELAQEKVRLEAALKEANLIKERLLKAQKAAQEISAKLKSGTRPADLLQKYHDEVNPHLVLRINKDKYATEFIRGTYGEEGVKGYEQIKGWFGGNKKPLEDRAYQSGGGLFVTPPKKVLKLEEVTLSTEARMGLNGKTVLDEATQTTKFIPDKIQKICGADTELVGRYYVSSFNKGYIESEANLILQRSEVRTIEEAIEMVIKRKPELVYGVAKVDAKGVAIEVTKLNPRVTKLQDRIASCNPKLLDKELKTVREELSVAQKRFVESGEEFSSGLLSKLEHNVNDILKKAEDIPLAATKQQLGGSTQRTLSAKQQIKQAEQKLAQAKARTEKIKAMPAGQQGYRQLEKAKEAEENLRAELKQLTDKPPTPKTVEVKPKAAKPKKAESSGQISSTEKQLTKAKAELQAVRTREAEEAARRAEERLSAYKNLPDETRNKIAEQAKQDLREVKISRTQSKEELRAEAKVKRLEDRLPGLQRKEALRKPDKAVTPQRGKSDIAKEDYVARKQLEDDVLKINQEFGDDALKCASEVTACKKAYLTGRTNRIVGDKSTTDTAQMAVWDQVYARETNELAEKGLHGLASLDKVKSVPMVLGKESEKCVGRLIKQTNKQITAAEKHLAKLRNNPYASPEEIKKAERVVSGLKRKKNTLETALTQPEKNAIEASQAKAIEASQAKIDFEKLDQAQFAQWCKDTRYTPPTFWGNVGWGLKTGLWTAPTTVVKFTCVTLPTTAAKVVWTVPYGLGKGFQAVGIEGKNLFSWMFRRDSYKGFFGKSNIATRTEEKILEQQLVRDGLLKEQRALNDSIKILETDLIGLETRLAGLEARSKAPNAKTAEIEAEIKELLKLKKTNEELLTHQRVALNGTPDKKITGVKKTLADVKEDLKINPQAKALSEHQANLTRMYNEELNKITTEIAEVNKLIAQIEKELTPELYTTAATTIRQSDSPALRMALAKRDALQVREFQLKKAYKKAVRKADKAYPYVDPYHSVNNTVESKASEIYYESLRRKPIPYKNGSRDLEEVAKRWEAAQMEAREALHEANVAASSTVRSHGVGKYAKDGFRDPINVPEPALAAGIAKTEPGQVTLIPAGNTPVIETTTKVTLSNGNQQIKMVRETSSIRAERTLTSRPHKVFDETAYQRALQRKNHLEGQLASKDVSLRLDERITVHFNGYDQTVTRQQAMKMEIEFLEKELIHLAKLRNPNVLVESTVAPPVRLPVSKTTNSIYVEEELKDAQRVLERVLDRVVSSERPDDIPIIISLSNKVELLKKVLANKKATLALGSA